MRPFWHICHFPLDSSRDDTAHLPYSSSPFDARRFHVVEARRLPQTTRPVSRDRKPVEYSSPFAALRRMHAAQIVVAIVTLSGCLAAIGKKETSEGKKRKLARGGLVVVMLHDVRVDFYVDFSLPIANLPDLRFANGADIRRIRTSDQQTEVIIPNFEEVEVLDFDVARNYMFWTDFKLRKIYRAFANGTNVTEVGRDRKKGVYYRVRASIVWAFRVVFSPLRLVGFRRRTAGPPSSHNGPILRLLSFLGGLFDLHHLYPYSFVLSERVPFVRIFRVAFRIPIGPRVVPGNNF